MLGSEIERGAKAGAKRQLAWCLTSPSLASQDIVDDGAVNVKDVTEEVKIAVEVGDWGWVQGGGKALMEYGRKMGGGRGEGERERTVEFVV